MLGKKETKNKTDAIQRKIIWILSKLLPALYHTGPQEKKDTHTRALILQFSMPFKWRNTIQVSPYQDIWWKRYPQKENRKTVLKERW